MSPGTKNLDGLFWARMDILEKKNFSKNFKIKNYLHPWAQNNILAKIGFLMKCDRMA